MTRPKSSRPNLAQFSRIARFFDRAIEREASGKRLLLDCKTNGKAMHLRTRLHAYRATLRQIQAEQVEHIPGSTVETPYCHFSLRVTNGAGITDKNGQFILFDSDNFTDVEETDL